jgi:hypothetical protein
MANVKAWVRLNLNPAIREAIAGTGGGIEVGVVVRVALHLNPHPLKSKWVRHPTADPKSQICRN